MVRMEEHYFLTFLYKASISVLCRTKSIYDVFKIVHIVAILNLYNAVCVYCLLTANEVFLALLLLLAVLILICTYVRFVTSLL